MRRAFRLTGEVCLLRLGFLAAMSVGFAGCASGDDASEEPLIVLNEGARTHCTPGETQACLGAGACDGAQVCLPAGSGFGLCDCGDDSSKSDAPDTSSQSPTPEQPQQPTEPQDTTDPQDTPDPQDATDPQDTTEPQDTTDPQEPNMGQTCPDPTGATWPGFARVIIESVDWNNDRIVLRNVTNTDVSLENWAVHLGQSLLTLHFVSGFSVPANGTFNIYLRETGTNLSNAAYWGGTGPETNLEYFSGDVSVHSDVDNMDSPQTLEAYVRWGADPPYADQHHRDEAAAAGLWMNTTGAFVPSEYAHQGIMVRGSITTPAGYQAVAPSCM